MAKKTFALFKIDNKVTEYLLLAAGLRTVVSTRLTSLELSTLKLIFFQ